MKQPLTIDATDVQNAMARVQQATDRIQIEPETVEQDLARVVLGLMEFLRQLMELQAIRQMDAGILSPTQEDTLGTTLMKAEAAIQDVAAKFGLSPDDLALDLGPLGKTI